jgi:tetratricopeptide (TPR) repeat protein
MHNLACSLRGQGKYAEAEQILREVLDVQRRVLGPEHPDTLHTMGNVGFSLGEQGKYADAEQMYRELLNVQRRVLRPMHPKTLATVSILASLDSIRSVSTSIWQFLARTLIASRAAGSQDGVQTCEQRTSSAPPDSHPDAPPAKRARQ